MAGSDTSSTIGELPNGKGMAAILAAAIGCVALSVFAFLGDAVKSIGAIFSFYHPTGALSGVTDTAIIVWLVSWYVLAKRWGKRDVAVGRVSIIAFMLLVAGLLLTFPPFMDLLQGK